MGVAQNVLGAVAAGRFAVGGWLRIGRELAVQHGVSGSTAREPVPVPELIECRLVLEPGGGRRSERRLEPPPEASRWISFGGAGQAQSHGTTTADATTSV